MDSALTACVMTVDLDSALKVWLGCDGEAWLRAGIL